MLELIGNLWDYHIHHGWLVVTTNGDVNNKNEAVMGRGIAAQAKERFPNLPRDLAYYLKESGNIPHKLGKYLMYTLPVKHHWYERADIELIISSCHKLVNIINVEEPCDKKIYMPRPGCGNGQLSWEEVRPIIKNILSDNFIIVQIPDVIWKF